MLENFKLHMANEQCKHIYVAAAGSPKYLQMLEPFRKQSTRITLILGSLSDDGMRKLGMPAAAVSKVFSPPPGAVVHTGCTLGGAAAVKAAENIADPVSQR
jgi:hypothetical protein